MSNQCTQGAFVVPDWTVVTAPAARQALDDIIKCGKHESRVAGLDTQATIVLAVILRHYAAKAQPPTLKEIGCAAAMTTTSVQHSIDLLRRLDFVIVDPHDDAIIKGAYPFADRATGHSVTFERSGKAVSAMCALDALGIGAMCHENVVITSPCGFCGREIAGCVKDRGVTLYEIIPESSMVWISLNASYECAADTVCNEFLFFCCDDHLRQWRATHKNVEGHRLLPEEAFQIGKALFIDRAMIRDR